MNKNHPGWSSGLAGAVWLMTSSGLALFAAEPEPSLNRVWFGAEFIVNVTASFKQLGGYPARSDPGPPTRGVDHFYDDGYHRVDASENADGTSWFWGYDQATQLPGNDTLLLNSLSAPAAASVAADAEDANYGFELGYARELGQIKTARWGLETMLGYANFGFAQRGTVITDAVRLTDAYALGGVVVPEAPYRGTFEGPGPLISDTPTRTMSALPGGSAIDGSWCSETALYGLRLGPYLEIPITQHMGLVASGGFVGALVDTDFSFRESITVAGAGSLTSAGSDSESDWLPGAYADARIMIALSERMRGFLAARFQHLGRFSETMQGRTVEIDFNAAVSATIGIAYLF